MKFGTNLRRSVYGPWKDHYLDYSKLKELLREEDVDSGAPWSEDDESKFVDELINVQLEKVNSFQVEQHKQLRERTSDCESRLDKIVKTGKDVTSEQGDKKGKDDGASVDKETEKTLKEILSELDAISKETNELEKFSRLNFTGALKAAKKHDKRRGNNYRVRPILQVRLASLPFNSEDYSPLLYRLSTMYTFVRQNLEGKNDRKQSTTDSAKASAERFTSHKFFVHPENLLEVKTYVLRHLPVLVYTPNSVKVADGGQGDPTITSLYFDNPQFTLYNEKVEKSSGASSLRIQWHGQLADKPDLVMEKKTMKEGDDAEIARVNVKNKYVLPFIKGEYKMEKSVQKLRDRKGKDDQEAKDLEHNAEQIQRFIKEKDLQPLVRTNYTRTAFQIPGENRVRISIDTNLALIREDALDSDRPCRDPEDWHRSDIDDQELEYPFKQIRKGEVSRFPYAVLEIKIRDGQKKKKLEWVEELMTSHLVKEAPRFSKFVQGVASSFEDYVNTFPFWMSLLDTDIRRDPNEAFEEEQQKKQKQAEDEIAVGSLVGSLPKSYKPATSSPLARSGAGMTAREAKDLSKSRTISALATSTNQGTEPTAGEHDSDDDGAQAVPNNDASANTTNGTSALGSLFPSFSTSKYARRKRAQGFTTPNAKLPPGVSAPESWLKDAGPVRVEPKVWLANQRTFVKWQHISVLLATLALGLYNAASSRDGSGSGGAKGDRIAMALAGVYTLIAVFAGVWGWAAFQWRSSMIERRSGRDFDSVVGPLVITLALVVALGLNFGFKYHAVMAERQAKSFAHNRTEAVLGGSLEL